MPPPHRAKMSDALMLLISTVPANDRPLPSLLVSMERPAPFRICVGHPH
jgi:hypothetical protein